MDPNAWGTFVTAVLGGIGTLLVALNSRRSKTAELDEEDHDELDRFRDWRPDVHRWHGRERARMAEAGAPDLKPLPPFPPSKLNKKRKPVKTDDDDS
jgi:hypothetical protein